MGKQRVPHAARRADHRRAGLSRRGHRRLVRRRRAGQAACRRRSSACTTPSSTAFDDPEVKAAMAKQDNLIHPIDAGSRAAVLQDRAGPLRQAREEGRHHARLSAPRQHHIKENRHGAVSDRGPQTPDVAAHAYVAAEAPLIGEVRARRALQRLARRGAARRQRADPHRRGEQHPGRRRAACRPGLSAHDRRAGHGRPPGDAARLHGRRRLADRHPGDRAERRGDRHAIALSARARWSPSARASPTAR